MNNKIAMVNKELHNRLFDEEEWPENQEEKQPKIYRRHQLPPQLMLKNMIRKGLTNTQTLAHSRPKTALSNFKRTGCEKTNIERFRSTATANLEKRNTTSTNRRYEEPQDSNIDFDFSNNHPKEFDEFENILNKMKFQREQEVSRKKVKL